MSNYKDPPIYGGAEFVAGQEEPDEVPILAQPTDVASPATTSIVPIPVVGEAHPDYNAREGFTLLQKGLFFGVILGVVAVWMKMNGRKQKRYEKILAQ